MYKSILDIVVNNFHEYTHIAKHIILNYNSICVSYRVNAVKTLIQYLQRGFLIVSADNNHILSIIDRMICDPFIMIHIPKKLAPHSLGSEYKVITGQQSLLLHCESH